MRAMSEELQQHNDDTPGGRRDELCEKMLKSVIIFDRATSVADEPLRCFTPCRLRYAPAVQRHDVILTAAMIPLLFAIAMSSHYATVRLLRMRH